MSNELIKRIFSSILILPISLFFIIDGSFLLMIFLIFLFMVATYEWFNMNKNKSLTKILGMIFLVYSFYSAYELRNLINLNIFLYLLIVCILSDIGGYIFGNLFKGPKLTKISPNKTYSGSFGSFILPVIAVLIYDKYNNSYLDLIPNILVSKIGLSNDNLIILTILFISLISQTGDLIISYYKRLAKIKDTGKILPGHGGILDRLDGLIFTIPIFYIVTTL